jgi:HK97 family phage prohead protease
MSFQTSNFTETLYKSIPGQVNVNQAQGLVECFVAALGNKDSVGDICLPGCFSSSLKRRKPRVVWGHNWNEPIGKVLEIYEVGPNDPRLPAKMREKRVGGLFARVQFNLAAEKGREAFANVAFFGEEQEWSIGYKTLDAVFDSSQQANLLKEVELYEVSPVLHGANQLTATLSIKSDEQKTADSGPCWPGYEQLGMKPGKDGKMVPNCIPVDGGQKSADEPLKDPDGGLTAAGRKYFKRTEGANLKPGVKGPANTPEKMRRKGSFLTRFFTNPSGPMIGKNGKPTRLALSAAAWGEPVPKNAQDAAKLAEKGRNLLEKYSNAKEFHDKE